MVMARFFLICLGGAVGSGARYRNFVRSQDFHSIGRNRQGMLDVSARHQHRGLERHVPQPHGPNREYVGRFRPAVVG
jgi:hypothetical protein